jgi:hypothetical protein
MSSLRSSVIVITFQRYSSQVFLVCLNYTFRFNELNPFQAIITDSALLAWSSGFASPLLMGGLIKAIYNHIRSYYSWAAGLPLHSYKRFKIHLIHHNFVVFSGAYCCLIAG